MITQPYPSFIDPKVGGRAKPVSNGTIFIGQNQKDAIQFPEKVYYTDSKGTEIEISQPIYLNSAGVTVDSKNSSTVISPYTKSVSYSILIKNSNENPVYINDSVSGYASTEEVANAAGYPWVEGEISVKDRIYNYQPADGPLIKVYDPVGGNVLGAYPGDAFLTPSSIYEFDSVSEMVSHDSFFIGQRIRTYRYNSKIESLWVIYGPNSGSGDMSSDEYLDVSGGKFQARLQIKDKIYNTLEFGAFANGVDNDYQAISNICNQCPEGSTLKLASKHMINAPSRNKDGYTQTSVFFIDSNFVTVTCDTTCWIDHTSQDFSSFNNIQNLFLFKNPARCTVENVFYSGVGDHIDDGTDKSYTGYILGAEGSARFVKLINSKGKGGLGGARIWSQANEGVFDSESFEVLDCDFENVRYPMIANHCKGVVAKFTANGVHRAFFGWDIDGVELDYTVSNCDPSVVRFAGVTKNVTGRIRHISNPDGKLIQEYPNNFQLGPASSSPATVSVSGVTLTIESEDDVSSFDIAKSGTFTDINLSGHIRRLRGASSAIFVGNPDSPTSYEKLRFNVDVNIIDGGGGVSGMLVGQFSNVNRLHINSDLTNTNSGGQGYRLRSCDIVDLNVDANCPSIGVRLSGMGGSIIQGLVTGDAPAPILRDEAKGDKDTLDSKSY